jgi:predicted secreted protein
MIKKGQQISLKINGAVIAKSTSCTLNITANTTDESSKDDEDPFFDNPTVANNTWNVQNESFVTTVTALKSVLTMFMAKKAVPVEIYDPEDVTTTTGNAVITGLTVSAQNGQEATLSLSLQGDGMYN